MEKSAFLNSDGKSFHPISSSAGSRLKFGFAALSAGEAATYTICDTVSLFGASPGVDGVAWTGTVLNFARISNTCES